VRIAYLNGICQRHDAISNAIRDEMGWLREAGHEVRLYAHDCDDDSVPHTTVECEGQVAFDPYFQQCDMAVFHFGVYYPLFNLLPVVPRAARRIVVFHNITPKRFLPPASHALIDKSFRQMSNIAFADHVVCDSETNRAVLREAGIGVPATVLPLAVHVDATAPPVKPSFADGLLRIAFVGRLVQSKAPLDLLTAAAAVLAASPALRLQVDLIANLGMSDPLLTAAVQERLAQLQAQFGARLVAALHANASDAHKRQVLAEADLFVLPTHHEGFCVPVLEALAAGCRVLSYDNSNVPAVAGGLATLVPTGDTDALGAALAQELRTVHSAAWRDGGYRASLDKAATHLATFAPHAVRENYLAFVRRQGAYWN
jgi:glycosyltransferase involved in cell wall biosynthesis